LPKAALGRMIWDSIFFVLFCKILNRVFEPNSFTRKHKNTLFQIIRFNGMHFNNDRFDEEEKFYQNLQIRSKIHLFQFTRSSGVIFSIRSIWLGRPRSDRKKRPNNRLF
jgi:hypothetical protein